MRNRTEWPGAKEVLPVRGLGDSKAGVSSKFAHPPGAEAFPAAGNAQADGCGCQCQEPQTWCPVRVLTGLVAAGLAGKSAGGRSNLPTGRQAATSRRDWAQGHYRARRIDDLPAGRPGVALNELCHSCLPVGRSLGPFSWAWEHGIPARRDRRQTTPCACAVAGVTPARPGPAAPAWRVRVRRGWLLRRRFSECSLSRASRRATCRTGCPCQAPGRH